MSPPALSPAVLESLRGLCDGRPIVIFDIEATGTDRVSDRVVEIAALRITPEGGVTTMCHRVNPGMRIPREVTAIHGISDDDVKSLPGFADVAVEIAAFFEGADLAGYSLRGLDLPLLQKEMERAKVPFGLEGRRVVDAQTIYFKKEPRDLSAALRYFASREHVSTHSALGDAIAAAEVLAGELARYPDLPRTLPELHRFSLPAEDRFVDPDKRFHWKDGQAVFGFGEYRGLSLAEVASRYPAYLDWVLNRDFSQETKRIVREAKRGVFPVRSG